jgi:hypothetical protein
MSECRWFAQFNGDDVHPSRDVGMKCSPLLMGHKLEVYRLRSVTCVQEHPSPLHSLFYSTRPGLSYCPQGGKLLFAEMLFNVFYHAEKWAETHPELAQQRVKVRGGTCPTAPADACSNHTEYIPAQTLMLPNACVLPHALSALLVQQRPALPTV